MALHPPACNGPGVTQSGPKLHGFAKEEYINGDRYEGTFKFGLRVGEGSYYLANGGWYEGDFVDGNMSGKGVCHFPRENRDGDTEFRKAFNRASNGDGKMSKEEALEIGITEEMFAIYDRDKSGFIDEEEFMHVETGPENYEGAWKDNMRHGFGQFTYRDGSTYVGQWEEDLRHGKGKLFFKHGLVSIGMWERDSRCGRSKIVLPDGTRFIGEMAHDMRNGPGRMEMPNGSQYQGQFLDDLPHGDGKLYKAEERSSYAGEFGKGCRSGTGIVFYHDTARRFLGNWVDDMPREGYTISPDGVVHKEYFTGYTVTRREVLSAEKQRQIVQDADRSAATYPALGPVDTDTFITASDEDKDRPSYKVKVQRFAKNRSEMAALTQEEDEFNF